MRYCCLPVRAWMMADGRTLPLTFHDLGLRHSFVFGDLRSSGLSGLRSRSFNGGPATCAWAEGRRARAHCEE